MAIQQKEEYDYMVKVVLLGDDQVGKTQIARRLVGLSFQQNYVPTIGVEFKVKTMQVDNQKLKFQVWDVAGLQKYRVSQKAYFSGAAAAIIVFSYNNQDSFNNIEKWIEEVNEQNQDAQQIVKILVGNKNDFEASGRDKISIGANQLAQRHNMAYIEVSAKENQNIRELFQLAGEQILKDLINPY